MNKENEYLNELMELEDLAEKKANVYSRLLMEPSLAAEMEKLSKNHKARKESIERLLYGKNKKDGGMSVLKGEEE
jgi:hypothetical protein